MSENIPESIPTSMDPRSQRPTKKRALSPTSQQSAQLANLFKNPERTIITSKSKDRKLAPPPEIVANVQGSSAGAGSGEFHVYKASRRREYERLKMMDEEVRKETEREEFETKAEELRRKDEERTAKNRAKRNKKKGGNKGGAGGNAATTGSEGSTSLQDRAQSGSTIGQSTASHDRTNGKHVNGNGGQQSNNTNGAPPMETPKGVVIFDDDD